MHPFSSPVKGEGGIISSPAPGTIVRSILRKEIFWIKKPKVLQSLRSVKSDIDCMTFDDLTLLTDQIDASSSSFGSESSLSSITSLKTFFGNAPGCSIGVPVNGMNRNVGML